MHDRALLLRGRLDHLTNADDVSAFVGRETQAESRRVGDDVEHPAVRDVDHHRAEVRYFDIRVEISGEGGDVPEGDAFHFAVRAIRAHLDESRGRLEGLL